MAPALSIIGDSAPDTTRILMALEQAPGDGRVLVYGDLMMDCNAWGSVHRISPEAPVPVVNLERRSESAGGAGNVALNLVGLGISVAIAGAVGDDDTGRRLIALLDAAGVDTQLVVTLPDRPTTTKTRVFAQQQQLLRIDEEQTEDWPASIRAALMQKLLLALENKPAALVLSEYAKGSLDPSSSRVLIAGARRAGVPVMVDPKWGSYSAFRGATVLTPNRRELAQACGLPSDPREPLEQGAWLLAEQLGLEAILITLGSLGASLVSDQGCLRLPAQAREVYDVTGAGDAVVAALTAALVWDLGLNEAAWLANLAGGLAVEQMGVAQLQREQLIQALSKAAGGGLILQASELEQAACIVDQWRQRGERVVFTNGCFDLLHLGHLHLLERAGSAGDRLVVGLNSDPSVRALKGVGRPVKPQEDRANLLAALPRVDMVVVFDEPTPLRLIERLRPAVLVKGEDYEEHEIVGSDQVLGWGGEVLRIPLLAGHSTTQLVAGWLAGGDKKVTI